MLSITLMILSSALAPSPPRHINEPARIPSIPMRPETTPPTFPDPPDTDV